VVQRDLKLQNLLLLVASYFFYACWDWRFLFLLVFSTLLDYFTGIKIYEATESKRRKFWLWLSISVNLGFLGIFKYYNFFAESFSNALSFIGLQANLGSLNIILPVGISFYTFHGLSYVIDIYKKRILPEYNFNNYSVFVSFFPLLVAGPIERATHLLPQISAKKELNYNRSIDGVFQILWGLFKKIVIADNAALLVNDIFTNSSNLSGSALLLGAVLFAFQIYGDFSGYSDIAIGVAKLFGIELLTNFRFPYFSRDIAEFWRRWHISLTTWFRDYIYIPLGGSKVSLLVKIRNTFIIFIISGFWHGANWTFIVWGLLNAFYFLPLLLTNKNRNNLVFGDQNSVFEKIRELVSILLTFTLTTLAWVFFRAKTVEEAVNYISGIFSASVFSFPKLMGGQNITLILVSFMITLLIAVEWKYRKSEFVFKGISNSGISNQVFTIANIITLIFIFGGSQQNFIYFQF